MNLAIYYIGCVTKKPEWNVNRVNPLYLMVNRIDGVIEDGDECNYLNIAVTDRNSEVLKNIQKYGTELNTVLKKYMTVNWESMTKIL